VSEIRFSEDAWDEYMYWLGQDKKTLRKINKLIKSAQRDPFNGEGKPEPLKNKEGDWSRRINEFDRLVYRFEDGTLFIKQCKGHYED